MTQQEYEKKLFAMHEANVIMGETIKSQEAENERLKAELAHSVKLPIVAYSPGCARYGIITRGVNGGNAGRVYISLTKYCTRKEAEAELERRIENGAEQKNAEN